MIYRIFNKMVWVILGSALMGLGIALTVQAELGIDPLSAFISGVGIHTGLSIGWSARLVMICIMCGLVFIDRRRIGIGTVVNGLLVGTFTDLFLSLELSGANLQFSERILFLSAGTLLLGIGIGLYISAGLGEAGVDSVMVLISERLSLPIQFTRIGLDIILVIIAFFIGGQVDYGTFLSMAINGMIIGKTLLFFNRHLRFTIEDKESDMVTDII